jgi:hypothetical protein
MTILNRPSHGLPNIIIPLWKTLRVMGSMSEEQLLGLCEPSSLGSGETQKTLRTCKSHGIFRIKEKKIELSDKFKKCDLTDPLFRELRSQLLTVILDEKHNAQLGMAEPELSGDFTYAASWVCGLDVFSAPGGPWGDDPGIQQLQAEQVADIEYSPFRNDTRWSGFKDWASFLGIGWIQIFGPTSYLNIDPTEALKPHLASIFGKSKEIPQHEFIESVSNIFPFLDRGKYQKIASKRFRTPWRNLKNHEISPAITRALYNLKRQKMIQLHNRSDGRARTLLGNNFAKIEELTHVSLEVN